MFRLQLERSNQHLRWGAGCHVRWRSLTLLTIQRHQDSLFNISQGDVNSITPTNALLRRYSCGMIAQRCVHPNSAQVSPGCILGDDRQGQYLIVNTARDGGRYFGKCDGRQIKIRAFSK